MTWGQLRLELQAGAPGVSLDLIDGYLRDRYDLVLEATDWSGLHYHATLSTHAAYQSVNDTVTLTVGSPTVTGVGTAWTSGLLASTPKFYQLADTVVYTATFVSAVSLTLDRPFEGNGVDAPGTVYPGSKYVLMQNVYLLPPDVRSIVSLIDPVSGWPLNPTTKHQLDASAGPRTLVGNPLYYAPYDDTNEASPPVLSQIELYPPPVAARGMPLEYIHAASFFDGVTTTASPLPFVCSAVLLYGCRADIAVHLEKMEQAAAYEAKFAQELDHLLLLEHAQRRVKSAFRFANRFTRHRLERAARGVHQRFGF